MEQNDEIREIVTKSITIKDCETALFANPDAIIASPISSCRLYK